MDDIPNNLALIIRIHSQLTAVNSAELWYLCVRRMTTPNWYRVVPSQSSSADVGVVKINILKFENMIQNYDGVFKIHMASTHPRGEKLQYFICHSDPLLQNPTKQRNINRINIFASTGLR